MITMYQPQFWDYDDVRLGPAFVSKDKAQEWVDEYNTNPSRGRHYVDNWEITEIEGDLS